MSEPEVMAMHAKDVLGRSGEQAAAEYLESCGLRILDRNWRCAAGEIDIVAVDRQALVVVEVKARTGMRYGGPPKCARPAVTTCRCSGRPARARPCWD